MLSGSDQASTQFEARYPSGKGEVCKTFMRRFDPDPRLQIFNHLTFGIASPRLRGRRRVGVRLNLDEMPNTQRWHHYSFGIYSAWTK